MKKAGWIFLAVLLVWTADVLHFARHLLPENLPTRSKNTPHAPYDLIAVVTGGQGRLREAFDIFKREGAKYLFVSGVDSAVRLEGLLQAQGIEKLDASLKSRVYLGSHSNSTRENAREIADFATIQHIENLLLITSSYHQRRAFSLLQAEFKNRDMTERLEVLAVESRNFSRLGWWKTRTGWSILLSEYFKSLDIRVRGLYI